jgi:hypothetical protein
VLLFDTAYHAYLQIVDSSGNETASFKWSLFSSGNFEFFKDLSAGISAFETKHHGLVVNVEQVVNGIINLIADFEVKEFRNSDYDKTRAIQQWKSQQPMGHQTLFHFAQKLAKIPLELGEIVLAEISPGPWNMKYRIAKVNQVLNDQIYQVKLDGIKKERKKADSLSAP